MEAVVGDEVDKDGWEYATNFSSFSIASKRRSSRAMDCVRRRRWLRSRIPTAGSVDKRFRPLTVFWDVQVLQSGTRRVDVRSGLKIQNLMPFPIMVSFTGPAWVGPWTLDPSQRMRSSMCRCYTPALPLYGYSQHVNRMIGVRL
jgi:hypothetical protein